MSEPREQLDQTLAFTALHGLELLALMGNTKRPAGSSWNTTTDPEIAAAHVERGHGLGIVLGKDAGVLAFDGDSLEGVRVLEQRLGELPRHSVGRADRWGHAFFQWTPGLNAKVFGEDGAPIADIKGASGKGYVIAPSGVGYLSDGKEYLRTWAVDARALGLEPMPEPWCEYLSVARNGGKVGDEGSRLVTHSAPIQTFTLSAAAYVTLHNALVKVWQRGRRNDICGATAAILYQLGVSPKQIGELVFEVAVNARDSEKRMRMINVRNTIKRVDEAKPCRGASTFRVHGLEGVLSAIKAAVEADKAAQFGPLGAIAYGAGHGDRQ